MQTENNHQRPLEVNLIHYGVLLTYPIYLLGGLYITGSLLGWLILLLIIIRNTYSYPQSLSTAKPNLMANLVITVWFVSVSLLLVSLFVSHITRDLGFISTLKSLAGFFKGWALIPVFIYIGYSVNMSAEKLSRVVCWLMIHSLLFLFISIIAYMLGTRGNLYISPIAIIGGAGASFFEVNLFGINPETGLGRWPFFAPWAPAAGFLSCLFTLLCAYEKDRKYRWLGVLGGVGMCIFCQSRVGWVVLFSLLPLYLCVNKLTSPVLLIVMGFSSLVVLLLGSDNSFLSDSINQIQQLRPNSTFVRQTLADIALQRWYSDAPVWGHGNVEIGPSIVEGMVLGSHHTWYGLLFVKGLVGLVSLAIPLILTTLMLLVKAQISQQARISACLCYVIIVYSFFENVEILTYLIWPALLWIGMSLKHNRGDSATQK